MADLNDAPRFALCVALGVSLIIKPLLESLRGADPPPGSAVHAAVAVVLVLLPFAYLASIVLLQLRLAPPDPAQQARRFACLACTLVSALLVVLAVPLVAFWLVADGGGQ
ncbi:uncharacterized protein LOC120702923 [Panicum virgatum]|uniref:Uncharacterized protein n=1 Tax=Panicum virgatum TaxID=38727 RepID=A0A8T0TMX1_PANVG|nr:uncharacterized protein LOC120702923 [Panicum virgatum]XP_039842851.1 uncharacterized protein LOC120702923 [Panicum virgatum]KAG2610146.1 hypothetical protein PVAP13_4KG099400 [Panicum virgatum]